MIHSAHRTASRLARRLPLAALLLASLGAAWTTGCSALTAKIPVERVVLADSEKIVWDALRAAIYGERYRVGGGARASDRSITSGWKLDLQPFRGKGYRTRVIASYAPEASVNENGLEAFAVSIRIEKQTNESLVNQMDPRYAKWKPADDDASIARRIMQNFHGSLGTAELELSTEPTILDEVD